MVTKHARPPVKQHAAGRDLIAPSKYINSTAQTWRNQTANHLFLMMPFAVNLLQNVKVSRECFIHKT